MDNTNKFAPELVEALAAGVHEEWMRGRLQEGWVLGPQRDDRLKTHPGLIPYEKLPESEKDYDRRTALKTLETICRLGFRVVRDQKEG